VQGAVESEKVVVVVEDGNGEEGVRRRKNREDRKGIKWEGLEKHNTQWGKG